VLKDESFQPLIVSQIKSKCKHKMREKYTKKLVNVCADCHYTNPDLFAIIHNVRGVKNPTNKRRISK
jgi:hypothetical protein